MDVLVDHDDDKGIVFTAVSVRAIALFEQRMGRGVTQFYCDGNPEDVFGKLPEDWAIGLPKEDKKTYN